MSEPFYEISPSQVLHGRKTLSMHGEAWGWMHNKKNLGLVSECKISGLSVAKFAEQVFGVKHKLSALTTIQFSVHTPHCSIEELMHLSESLPNLQHLAFGNKPGASQKVPFTTWLLPCLFSSLESTEGVPV